MYPCVCDKYSGLFGVQGASNSGYCDQFGGGACDQGFSGNQYVGGMICPNCGMSPCVCGSGTAFAGYGGVGGFADYTGGGYGGGFY